MSNIKLRNIVPDSSGVSFLDNAGVSIQNITPSTTSSTGCLVLSGGLGIINSTNSVSATNGGAFTVAGGIGIGKNLCVGEKIISTDTTASTSVTTGSVILDGGIGISNTTDAVSASNGGALTIAGGVGIGKKVFTGGVVTLLEGGVVSNNKTFNFLDVSGTMPYFITQNDNNFVFYGTDDVGVQRSIYSIGMRDSDSSFFLEPATNLRDTTDSTASNLGALIVDGGISSQTTTDALSASNGGGLTLAGGAGIAKKLYVGTDINAAGTTASTSNTTGAITTAGGVGISNVTDATDATNGGSLTVAGGAAIAKKLYVGGATEFSGGAGKYLKFPSLTTTERDALTASAGMHIYNSTTNRVNYYDGTRWLSFDDEYIYLEDYNPGTDTSTDSASAIQSAVNAALAQEKPLYFPHGREFRIDSQIAAQINNSSPLFVLLGNNSRIFPNFNGSGLLIEPLCPIASLGSGQEVAHFEIHDLEFDGFFETSYANMRALEIGKVGFALSDFKQSLVRNSRLTGFTKNNPVYIGGSHTRHINFENVISRANGFEIIASEDGGFIGDMFFFLCEATFQTGYQQALNIFASGTASTSQLRGLHFYDCTFYGGELNFGAGSFGQLADVWLTDCAIDQGAASTNGININGSGGQIIQFFVQNLYCVGLTGKVLDAVYNGGSVATSKQLAITGGNFSFSTATNAVSITNGQGFLIQGVQFVDWTGTECIDLIGCSKSVISNNNYSSTSGGTITNLLVTDSACADLNICNNTGDTSGDLIVDNMSSSNKMILGNRKSGVAGCELLNTALTISETTATTSSTTGALTSTGGISSSNVTDATSSTNGGSLTLAGGAAVAKKLYIGGETTAAENVNINNNKSLILKDASGTNPRFVCQNDDNFLFYGTDAAGADRAIFAVAQRNSSSTFNTKVAVVGEDTTDASSSTTGSFKTAGGAGIAKKLYVGTDINAAGTTASTSNTTGAITTAGGFGISNTTDATSATNGGTITTAGGVGIAKKLYVGTDSYTIGDIRLDTNNKSMYFKDASGSTPRLICQSDDNFIFYGTDNLGADRAIWTCDMRSATSKMLVPPGLDVTNTTDSSSSTTGALITAGGAGIAKKLYVGTDLDVGGTITKAAGSFVIPHPDPVKQAQGYKLKHCFVESNTRGENLYRYTVTTVSGSATITLPDYFSYINENVQIFVSAKSVLGYGMGVVNEGLDTVTITTNVDGDFNILVIGTRSDQVARDFFEEKGGAEYIPQ